MVDIEIICKGRGQGKTYDLILESARTGIPILTAYNSRHIIDQARWMGVKIHQPMTVQEYKYFKDNGSLLNSKDWKDKLLIDEVDGVLEQLLETHIEKVTCTSDSMNEKGNKIMISKGGVEYCLGEVTAMLIQELPVFDHNQIKNVIFNNPATIVLWKDGTKTVVKCQENDTYNPEMGLAMCIIKKMCGNKGNYNEVFNKWIPKEKQSLNCVLC